MATRIDRGKMMRLIRAAAICAAVAIALAFALEGLQLATQPKQYSVSYEENGETQSLDLSSGALIESSLVDGKIVVDGGPAQVDFLFDEAQEIDKLALNVGQTENDYIVRVLYAKPGESCSLENSLEVVGKAGQSELMLGIPSGTYGQIAIQIAGNVTVQGIDYSSGVTTVKTALPERIKRRRVLTLTVLLFCALILLEYLGFRRNIVEMVKRMREKPGALRGNYLAGTITFIATGVITYLLVRLLVAHDLQRGINWMLNTLCISAALCVASILTFRRTLANRPEVFFVIIALLIGGMMSFFYPDTRLISWDDEFHYMNALRFSYLGEERLTEQDQVSISTQPEQEHDLSKLDQWHAEQDFRYQQGAVSVVPAKLNYGYFCSLVQGIGLYLGRVLGLSYWLIWGLGRFFGLLAYAIIGFFAIRRLHSGKMMAAAVLLIPEALFLASQYSYDPGVTSFITLGMCYCYAEWQEMDRTISWKNAFIMILAMFMGCLIKAIYFPVLLIPLFFPKKKYRDMKHRRQFFILSISAMIALVLYFMVPFLSGNGAGDTRGGEDVNSFGQIMYILKNPIQYTNTLISFLRSYIGIDNVRELLCHFAYQDHAPKAMLYALLMAVVTFTDREERDQSLSDKGWVRLLSLLIFFGTICLIATALYVSFTPVGLNWINGCQPRYVIPVMLPAMMMMGTGRIVNRTNRALYHGIVFAIICYVDFSAVLFNCLAAFS